jgi:hypothetical protein
VYRYALYDIVFFYARETSDSTAECRALLTGGKVAEACAVLQAAGDHRYSQQRSAALPFPSPSLGASIVYLSFRVRLCYNTLGHGHV